jgi:TonB family protein
LPYQERYFLLTGGSAMRRLFVITISALIHASMMAGLIYYGTSEKKQKEAAPVAEQKPAVIAPEPTKLVEAPKVVETAKVVEAAKPVEVLPTKKKSGPLVRIERIVMPDQMKSSEKSAEPTEQVFTAKTGDAEVIVEEAIAELEEKPTEKPTEKVAEPVVEIAKVEAVKAEVVASAPAPGETVHELADFKQVAGNPKPQYSSDDRLAAKSGTVIFTGLVKKDGSLDSIQMTESSGHRSLDLKSLLAVKKWRFSTGNEGWVEIPFKWDLTGDSEEVSPLGRRANR